MMQRPSEWTTRCFLKMQQLVCRRQTERMQCTVWSRGPIRSLAKRERVQGHEFTKLDAHGPDGLMESRASESRAFTGHEKPLLLVIHVSRHIRAPNLNDVQYIISRHQHLSVEINHSCRSFCCDLANCVPSDILRAELDII